VTTFIKATEISLKLSKKELLHCNWIKSKEKLQPNLLYQPIISNLESGDAFGLIPSGEDNEAYYLIVLQITVSDEHPVKVKGLNRIIAAYSKEIQNNITRKFLIFVTPLHGKLNSIQPYHVDGKVAVHIPKDIKKFEQCTFRYEISIVRR